MSLSRIFNVANSSFDAFRENKVLAKISEFTVLHYQWRKYRNPFSAEKEHFLPLLL